MPAQTPYVHWDTSRYMKNVFWVYNNGNVISRICCLKWYLSTAGFVYTQQSVSMRFFEVGQAHYAHLCPRTEWHHFSFLKKSPNLIQQGKSGMPTPYFGVEILCGPPLQRLPVNMVKLARSYFATTQLLKRICILVLTSMFVCNNPKVPLKCVVQHCGFSNGSTYFTNIQLYIAWMSHHIQMYTPNQNPTWPWICHV